MVQQNNPLWDMPRVVESNDSSTLISRALDPYPNVPNPRIYDLFSESRSSSSVIASFGSTSGLSSHKKLAFHLPNGQVACFAHSTGAYRVINPITATAVAAAVTFDASSEIAVVCQLSKNKYRFVVVMLDGQVWYITFDQNGLGVATSAAANILSDIGSAMYHSSIAMFITPDDDNAIIVNTNTTIVYAALYKIGATFTNVDTANSGVISGAGSISGGTGAYGFIDVANSDGDLHGAVSGHYSSTKEERGFHLSYTSTSITLNAYDYVVRFSEFLNERTLYETIGENLVQSSSLQEQSGGSYYFYNAFTDLTTINRSEAQIMTVSVTSVGNNSSNYFYGRPHIIKFFNCPVVLHYGNKKLLWNSMVHTIDGDPYGTGVLYQCYLINEKCALVVASNGGSLEYIILSAD